MQQITATITDGITTVSVETLDQFGMLHDKDILLAVRVCSSKFSGRVDDSEQEIPNTETITIKREWIDHPLDYDNQEADGSLEDMVNHREQHCLYVEKRTIEGLAPASFDTWLTYIND